MFIPLYVKSEYSILNSPNHLDDLIDNALFYNYHSLALTDDGVMYGAIKFYKKCTANNIKPIIGLKVAYNLNGLVSNVLLYAMDILGYRNLMYISSKYKITNHPIDIEDLAKHSLGLICVTPGIDSFTYSYLRNQNYQTIKDHLAILKSSFEYLYIGLTLTTTYDIENYDNYYEYFKGLGYDCVALAPIFYLTPDDTFVYQVLNAIKVGREIKQLSEHEQNAYMLSNEEAELLFSKHPDTIVNTEKIAKMCDLTIKFGELQLPSYSQNIDAKKYLLELAIAGLKKRIKINNITNTSIYYERLEYEYKTICEMGFEDYFLIVWDYVKFAKLNQIFVGPGRGSAGASLIAYSLGITDIDPIKYDLLFERFLNKERISMPDIDIDFPDDLRDKVIKYVGNKYSKARVAHIATFGTFQLKLALNEVSKTLKTPESHLKQVLKIINESQSSKYNNAKLRDIINESDLLKQLMDEYDTVNNLLRIAVKIQGLPRNISTHAAGIIITKYNLLNYTALDNGLDDIYQTQYEASDLEALGLLKMDVRIVC